MSGSTNLQQLIASMNPVLQPETFVFVTTPDERLPEGISPVMQFREAEGMTFIAPFEAVQNAGLAYEFVCRMITLDIHSSLEAVGFMAAITTHLATLGVGVNPVSGFYHDHLFVPANCAGEVMAALKDLTQQAV